MLIINFLFLIPLISVLIFLLIKISGSLFKMPTWHAFLDLTCAKLSSQYHTISPKTTVLAVTQTKDPSIIFDFFLFFASPILPGSSSYWLYLFFFKSKHTCSHHFLPPSLLPLWLKPPSLFAGFTAILSQLVVRLLPPQPKGQRDPIKTVRTRLSFCGSSYIPEWESSLFSQPYVTCPHTVLNPFTALPCSLASVTRGPQMFLGLSRPSPAQSQSLRLPHSLRREGCCPGMHTAQSLASFRSRRWSPQLSDTFSDNLSKIGTSSFLLTVLLTPSLPWFPHDIYYPLTCSIAFLLSLSLHVSSMYVGTFMFSGSNPRTAPGTKPDWAQ